MPALKKSVVTDTLEEVQVHYLDKIVSGRWNAGRGKDDTPAFCGWYWLRGVEEGGPFRTRSAALRDAYYQFVAQRPLPKVWANASKNVLRHARRISKKAA